MDGMHLVFPGASKRDNCYIEEMQFDGYVTHCSVENGFFKDTIKGFCFTSKPIDSSNDSKSREIGSYDKNYETRKTIKNLTSTSAPGWLDKPFESGSNYVLTGVYGWTGSWYPYIFSIGFIFTDIS